MRGHCEAMCLGLHPKFQTKSHVAKRRVWRVKSIEYEELLASPIQKEKIIQGEITIYEICITIEENSTLIPTIMTTTL